VRRGSAVLIYYVIAESCGKESRIGTAVISYVLVVVVITLTVKVMLDVFDGYVRTEAGKSS